MNWTAGEDGTFSSEIDGERYTVFRKAVTNGEEWWHHRLDGGHQARGGFKSPEAAMHDLDDLAEHKQQLNALGRVRAVGISPPEAKHTPWGRSQSIVTYAPGVEEHSTAGHGGFWVALKRHGEMPASLRLAGGWYEEDVEWSRVALAFPDLFTARERRHAEETLINWRPEVFEAWSGRTLGPGESRVKDEALWDKAHAADLVVASASIYQPDRTYVVVSAVIGGIRSSGGKPFAQHFLVPAEEYEKRSPFGFVVDLERHREIDERLGYLKARDDLTETLRTYAEQRSTPFPTDPGDGSKLSRAFVAAYAQSQAANAPRYLFAVVGREKPYVVSETPPPAGTTFLQFDRGRVFDQPSGLGLSITSIALRDAAAAEPVVKGRLVPTQAEARATLASLGMTLRVTDGEFRVNFLGADEATAYYTNDICDAIGTAQAMVRTAAKQKSGPSAAPAARQRARRP